MSRPWLSTPEQKYGPGLGSATTATRDATATVTVAPTVVPAAAGLLSPKDPMFWFGVIAAGTVALMAYSTLDAS